MDNSFLTNLRRKENECRNYQAQAQSYLRLNNYKADETICNLLQRAANLEFEMASMTFGAEKEHHEREKARQGQAGLRDHLRKRLMPPAKRMMKNGWIMQLKAGIKKSQSMISVK